MMMQEFTRSFSGQFFLIAGPCVLEDEQMGFPIAEHILQVCDEFDIPFIFKASYRKANRSRLDSFTGIGDEKALTILQEIGETFMVPVITDVHSPDEAKLAASHVDMLQIPAFLSRQTELLIAAGETGKPVNIKKGQFLSAEAMRFAAEKVLSTGNKEVLLTERGTQFGYNDLIVDMRNIPLMRSLGFPVVVDVTHSLQQPNQVSGITGGQPALISTIARAAVASGADGIFLETHPNPAKARSDGSSMLPLSHLRTLLMSLAKIREAIKDPS